MKQYSFNKDFSLLENENEICFFWNREGRGTILRGLGAYLFTNLWKNFENDSFNIEDAIKLNLDFNNELWEECFNEFFKKGIIVNFNITPSKTSDFEDFEEFNIYIYGEETLINLFEDKFDHLVPRRKNINIFKNRVIETEELMYTETNINLILLIDNTHKIEKHLELNNLAISKKIPFLSCRIYGTNLEIGPFVFSGNSACFECYWNRLQANSSQNSIPNWILEANYNIPSVEHDTFGKALYDSALNEVCLEILRHIQKKHVPITIGNVFRRDILSNRTKLSPVLELFECKSCLQSEVF
ncbi:hypothetical protein [Bacillus anthracis]|uniref:hypothetical protein n=1 Tax=Bacillus anthracis TaxID=1392 RepID=UPI00099B6972|nr:hypothetical protein [Bacillus anthracis]OPD56274.1 hypothetical protein BVG01_25015 [Bacillus anthracis]